MATTPTNKISSSTSSNDPDYHVRPLLLQQLRTNSQRRMIDFIPTFSEDGISTEMPMLTLELNGLSGAPLSEDAYDAIQYAMSDYLYELLHKRWPSMTTVNGQVDNTVKGSDINGGGDSDGDNGGDTNSNRQANLDITPALTSVRVEVLADRPLTTTRRHHRRGRRRLVGLDRFLQEPVTEENAGEDAIGNAIDLMTTLVFRDLTRKNEARAGTAVVGGDEGVGADFNQATNSGGEAEETDNSNVRAISLPPEEIIQNVAGDAWNNLTDFQEYLYDSIGKEGESVVAQFVNLTGMSSAKVFPTSPPTIAPMAGPTDAPISAALDKPLLVPTSNSVTAVDDSTKLKYQESRINPLYPALMVGVAVFLCTIIVLGYRRRGSSDSIGNKPDTTLHVHDTYTVEGEEVIEVEDACFKFKKVSTAPSNSSEDCDRSGSSAERRGRRFCGRVTTCRALDNTYEESSEEDDEEDVSEHLGLRLPPLFEVPSEDMDLYADLTPEEKQQFLKFVESGMSIEEASLRVLEGRQQRQFSSRWFFSPTSPRRRSTQAEPERLNSEVMADGRTTVHIPQHLNDSTTSNSRCFRNPMFLHESDSSIGSSFDNGDYTSEGPVSPSWRGMGSILNLGKSKRNNRSVDEHSEHPSKCPNGKSSNRGGGRSSILCNPELGL